MAPSPTFSRVILLTLLTLSCLPARWARPAAEPPVAAPPRAAWIAFKGPIHPLSEHAFYRKLERARAAGVAWIFVEIDSPGGLVDSSFALAQRLADLDAPGEQAEAPFGGQPPPADAPVATSRVSVVAFIPREALSGGAIMALGCRKILMHPSARLGDAGPIFQDEKGDFRHAPEKIRTDLVRRVRDLAERMERPTALAEAMMDMDVEVFHVTHNPTGKVSYRSQAELDALPDPANWTKGPLVQESRRGVFLEVNGKRAVELTLADATAMSQEQVLEQFQIDRDHLWTFESDWVDTLAFVLNSWPATVLLLVIALTGLYVEFSAPGVSVGGLLALVCFALYFWSRFLGGTSGWLEVVLFLVGLTVLLLEFFVIPGFGVAGLFGMAFVMMSLVMAGQDFFIPHSGSQWQILLNSLAALCAAGIAFSLLAWGLSQYLGVIPLVGRLALQPPRPDPERAPTDYAGHAPISQLRPGQVGLADSALRPAGRALFDHQFYDVVSDGSFVEAGRPVRILEISGNRIVVREMQH